MNSKNHKKSKTGNNGSQQQQIIQKILKSVEKKKLDKYVVSLTSTSATAVPVYTDLTNLITEGTSVNNRIGTSVKLRRLTIRGSIFAGDPLQVMRIVVFRWKVSTTVDIPVSAELWDANAVSSTAVVYGNPLPLKPSRFQIIKDVTWSLAANWQPILPIHMEIPLQQTVEYDPGVNTGTNHLYVMVVADSSVVPHPYFNLNYMLHYHDTE